ncbi:hypothetical protein, partial [Aeromonas diversa]|uniref:hypothetical protein n=1 Tax=Aeromonas diversa TaxID=502790 RepID=UPI0034620780
MFSERTVRQSEKRGCQRRHHPYNAPSPARHAALDADKATFFNKLNQAICVGTRRIEASKTIFDISMSDEVTKQDFF